MEDFPSATVPPKICIADTNVSYKSITALSELELRAHAKEIGNKNAQFKSYIGMGYHNAVVPPVILRNISYM